uniref:Uncharacterized protein n=1 Tax=viral metagenome TaxID=1070528 RepID=A0A6C0CKB1_9ZZZZ
MEKLQNFTPHDISLYLIDDQIFVFPRNGKVARLSEKPVEYTTFDQIPCRPPYTYGDVEGIGECKENMIVSALVAEKCCHLQGYKNVFSPDMGKDGAIRDEKGAIVGTKRLVKWC